MKRNDLPKGVQVALALGAVYGANRLIRDPRLQKFASGLFKKAQNAAPPPASNDDALENSYSGGQDAINKFMVGA